MGVVYLIALWTFDPPPCARQHVEHVDVTCGMR